MIFSHSESLQRSIKLVSFTLILFNAWLTAYARLTTTEEWLVRDLTGWFNIRAEQIIWWLILEKQRLKTSVTFWDVLIFLFTINPYTTVLLVPFSSCLWQHAVPLWCGSSNVDSVSTNWTTSSPRSAEIEICQLGFQDSNIITHSYPFPA